MALEWLIPKEEEQETCDSFILNDTTVYGGANDDRNERANTLFVTKTDENGVRTLVTITPDTADPVTVSSWTVLSELDGWYEKLMASVKVHVADQSYASAGIVLYSAGVFYKTKQADPAFNNPPNAMYYDVITAASLYTDELANTSIDWGMLDEFADCRTKDRIRELHEDFADKFLSAKCDPNYYSPADFLDGLLNAAHSAFDNDRPQDMEVIIRTMETYFVNPA
jgi:hypothetical protein